VVQTGVKSLGWENRMPQLSPSHSWKLMVPSVVSAVKSGAVSPSRIAMVRWVPPGLALSKPVIAAVEGYAVAGGLELAIWCDLRVASAAATFGVFCRRFGIPLIDGGTVRLPRLIGQGRALDLVLTGRDVGAEEALAIGLVDRVVTPGSALDAAVQLGLELAALPQTCMRNDRASLLAQWDLSLADALRSEFRYGRDSLASPDARSGPAGFASGAGRGGSRVGPDGR
jgi:enoyl-CoA hydratase